jgi:MarR family 2-MHQ and catechol resistance regulon transcriptional repressor
MRDGRVHSAGSSRELHRRAEPSGLRCRIFSRLQDTQPQANPVNPETTSALKLWVVMNRALRSVEDPLRRQVEAHGLSMTEFAVLEVLFAKGALPIGEIGGRVLRSSGSMTYVVDKLETRGLLRRRACPADRRVIYGELTEEGHALVGRVFPEHAALVAALTQGLQQDEQAAVAELLKRMGLFAQAYGGAVETPA